MTATTKRALSREADRILANADRPVDAPTLAQCLLALASVDRDRAATENGIGFSRFDGEFGHKMSAYPEPRWSPKQRRAVWVMTRKYRNQLTRMGIDFDTIPEPPVVTEEIQREYEANRDRLRGATVGAPAGNGRVVEWPNSAAPFAIVRFPYDPALLAELKQELGGMGGLRWIAEEKAWRYRSGVTPEEARAAIRFFATRQFVVDPGYMARLEDYANAGERRKEASKATSTDWQPPALLRNLYPFQRAGVDYIVNHAGGRGMIADEMGLGKSIQSVAAIHALSAYPCLMITKASTKYAMRNEWLATIPGMIADDVYVVGSKWDAEKAARAKVCIVNYDLVAKHRDTMMAIPFEGLIVDESHRCKSHAAQRTEAIKAIATGRAPRLNEQGKAIKINNRRQYEQLSAGIKHRILLTGTPIVNRPSEMITQLEIMGRLDDLGGFYRFREAYCNLQETEYGTREGEASTRTIAKLNERMRAVCYVQRTKKAVAPELPAIQRTIIPVELSATIRREYKRAEIDTIRYCAELAARDADFRASIAGLPTEEQQEAIGARRKEASERARRAQTIVMISHCKMIAGRGKVDAAKEWIADFLETGEKLIIFARYIETQRALIAACREMTQDHAVVHILGGDQAEARDFAKAAFQDNPLVKVIICATEAASEGVTLTAASNVLFADLEWVPAAHMQAEARCYGRINDLHGASAWYLIATDTIDESIMALLTEKMAVCEALTTGGAQEAAKSFLGDLVRNLVGDRKGRDPHPRMGGQARSGLLVDLGGYRPTDEDREGYGRAYAESGAY